MDCTAIGTSEPVRYDQWVSELCYSTEVQRSRLLSRGAPQLVFGMSTPVSAPARQLH